MYLAQFVELSNSESVLSKPRHPYTRALIDSVPQFETERRSAPLSGQVPDPHAPPSGCRFHPRCPVGPSFRPERTICVEQDPQAVTDTQPNQASCHFAAETRVPTQPGELSSLGIDA
jgi:peptide/nickel transport system ATP-binding protein